MQLSLRDAAAALKVSEGTVLRWIESAGLPAQRVQGAYRISPAELLEWATARRIEVPPGAFGGESADAHGVAASLERGGVHYGVPGADAAELLSRMVELLPLPQDADRGLLTEMLIARERLGSTAVGGGIAIPHVRHPVILPGALPMTALFFPAQPVDYGAPDGEPARALFLAITPNQRVHVTFLSRLAAVVADEGFRAALARQAPAPEILDAATRAEQARSH